MKNMENMEKKENQTTPIIDKKILENTIKKLMFVVKNEKEVSEIFDKEQMDLIASKLKEKGFCNNAEDTSNFVFSKIEDFCDELVCSILGKNIDTISNEELFLWENFRYICDWLEDFITFLEYSACSTDKATWLLHSYIKFKNDGTIPNLEDRKECFYKPKYGSWETWTEIIEGYILSQFSFAPYLLLGIYELMQERNKDMKELKK